MVKKVVNIGVEGNDASGDPIREAFNKVNENFNEIYSFFGSGDGISITALEEGPDEVTPNAILISNDQGDQYLSKTLEGDGGIEIVNDDPERLIIRSVTSSLAADTSPSLGNHLDATGFNIIRVGNPNPITAAAYGVSEDTFAINKGYADTRYVNASGDTMTGFLNVPAGASGTQVPRANEAVLRAGGTTSQMTGPLILERKIRDADNPLAAATKEYVDVNSFVSNVNLFVSTKGDDNQFDVDTIKKGRSEGYAFRTISAACRYAKTLIDASPLTVSITVKDITYGNGTEYSQILSMVDAGDYFVMTISNNGVQTDPRDAFDIRPGQIIKGKTSGAIARIEEVITPIVGNTESYRVVYESEEEFITDLGGERLEYGNPSKDLQITIFVESGNYYEHYPIRVPENVSIIGDELRRTIIRPRPGRSASWAIDTYFRRDPIFDQDLVVTDRLYGYHYLTNSSTSLYSGTVTNPGELVNASYILLQNREFIQEEVIGYVSEELRGLQYDEVKCRRDTGLIITALAYDMAFGSNFASIAAARAYYRGTQAAAVLGADKKATLESLDELETLLNSLVTGTLSQERISDNIALMKSIIDEGLVNVPLIVWPTPSDISAGYSNARTLIYNNRSFLQAEITAYIDQQIAANEADSESIWYNLNISGEACARDVGYIIDAVVYDLTYGGNRQTIDAARAYYFGASGVIAENEIEPTLEAYQILKERIQAIATGASFTNYQSSIPRIGGTPGSADAGSAAANLVEIVRYTLDNDGTTPAVSNPSLVSVTTELVTNFNLMDTNNLSLQDDIITYITNNFFIYNEDLCKRDVGLIIDAIGYDLVYGDYYRSLEAANSYFESASSLIAITDQLTETSAAINYIGTIAQRIVQKLTPLVSYQTAYPESTRIQQSRTMTETAEAGATTAIANLISLMIDIISEDPSVNAPKNNNDVDVFLMNDATIVRNLSCQEHGGFMCVLDPLGQILTKSPYVQTSSSFSRSINSKIFAGGMLVDAFAGNIPAQITSRVSDTEVLIDGVTVRPPNLPCAFYVNGVRFQVDLITEWDQELGTARLHINPATPDDPDYTLIEDSTRLFLPSTSIEFLSAGNNSMLCNDYTQLNDLGYGLVAINGGLLEAVGVFTYYNQISYFADTGGQIRSVGGSSAHGAFGLVAANSYPLEVPDDVYLLHDMVFCASVYSPYDYYPAENGTNLSGTGVGATFNITVNTTSYVVTVASPGSGYVNSNQIIILGSVFGGVTGVNDLTITVTSTGGGGTITGISVSGTIPTGAPINNYYNREDDIFVYIHDLTNDFQAANGSELEVVFGTAPNREIVRYLINNAQKVLDLSDTPVAPTGSLYRLNLASGGLGAGATGIQAALADGAKVTVRMNTSVYLYDINRETATRPSTALVFDEATEYVNRVIAISNISSELGSFEWLGSTATITSEAHGLTNTIPATEVYVVFLGGTNGNPSRGYYPINVIDVDTFEVTTAIPTGIFSEGAVTWGAADGQVEATIKEPFRAVPLTSYYDANDQRCQPFTITVDRSFASTDEFNCLSTTDLTDNAAIKFTGTVGGVSAGTTYYVKSVVSSTRFTISDTLVSGVAGPTRSLTDQTASMYGTVDPSFYTWGVTGSYKFAIRDLSPYDALRVEYGVNNGSPMIVGWRGRVHQITNYISSEDNGTDYAVVELDNLTGAGLIEPVGLLEGGWDNNPNLKGVLPADSPGNVTIMISTVRVTGHDMLEIGTGSYAQTNFPNTIFGRPDRDPDQASEVLEIGKGRCFFVTSDQDGNFRVGDFFQVDQGTGTVTFSSSIAISNLDGLGFKRGVAIAEFSVDDSMFDNATDTVPTEQAVRSYIDRRLGLTHNGSVINPASGRLIPPVSDSGFMALNGKLAMRANMDMGSFRIVNMLTPVSGSDAANKSYADTKLALAGGTMSGQIDMGGNKIVNLGAPTSNNDAATKLYVDTLTSAQNELRELNDVSLPNPISGVADNSIFFFNSTLGKFTNGQQSGDVLFTWDSGTSRFVAAIQPSVIVNADVSGSAAISQSKLDMVAATTRANATGITQADRGLASFDSANFEITDGWVGIKANGVALTEIAQISSDTVIGNSGGAVATPSEVSFATVVQEGGALYKSDPIWTQNGALVRTGASTFSIVPYTSSYGGASDNSTIVQRDGSGGFSASTINATTQFNAGGNKVIGRNGSAVEILSPTGNVFISATGSTTTAKGTWQVDGNWTLVGSSTLEATYAADLAEYYEGDNTYEPGTVLMLGGDKEVTLAKGQGTTRVAGVVSDNAAYIMNGACPGEKNLIALQGRVKCKVIGKIEKGDLMVVGIVPGVAMTSTDPKPGSIIGKALQNYDSDHVGIIEVMVGKH